MNHTAIIHLDMDAFYPAVEMLDNPALRGKPVIVGGSSRRGVVSSASYEARAFGVHSALPVATALTRCPHGVFLPVRMERYREVSRQVFAVFERYTPLVEPLSIDEAFLDVSGSVRLYGQPPVIAAAIRQAVKSELGLTVSAGVAATKFIAKIASDLEKPDGLTVVAPGCERQFLEPLPIGRLWGVGKVTRDALALLGVRTIGDLARLPRELLAAKFGRQGEGLHRLACGIDEREVEVGHTAKSIGNEDTFAEDIIDIEAARRELLGLAVRVGRRLRTERARGRTVTLKVKYADFQQITRSVTEPAPVDDDGVIFRRCCELLEKTEVGRRPVRLLGVTVSNLTLPGQIRQAELFGAPEPDRKRDRRNQAIDTIRGRFGESSILPGTLLKKS